MTYREKQTSGSESRTRFRRGAAMFSVLTAVLVSMALADGTPAMASASSVSGSSASAGSVATKSGGDPSSISLPTSTPAGNITMPDPNMQMMPGMMMAAPQPCTAMPTKAQQQAAVRLADTAWKDAQKYRSLAAAKAAGYVPITPSGHDVVHYLNRAYYRGTLVGGQIIDPREPQSLVYANTPKGAVLAAAMFITRTPEGPLPMPGGCLTQWHVHTNLCLTPELDVVGTVNVAHPDCPPGSVNRVTPAMMHTWFVPIPGGPTAIDAPDQQVVQAATKVPSPPNGTA